MEESRWKFWSAKIIGRQDNPMLKRIRIIQTPIGGVYLHFIHREDLDREPHDHPWWFASFILRGGYSEQYVDDSRLIGQRVTRTHKRWSLHTFPLRAAHRIVAVNPKTVTLVFVGPKTRTWGFYNVIDGSFIDWRHYVVMRPREAH